jgi:hypothetical protein
LLYIKTLSVAFACEEAEQTAEARVQDMLLGETVPFFEL